MNHFIIIALKLRNCIFNISRVHGCNLFIFIVIIASTQNNTTVSSYYRVRRTVLVGSTRYVSGVSTRKHYKLPTKSKHTNIFRLISDRLRAVVLIIFLAKLPRLTPSSGGNGVPMNRWSYPSSVYGRPTKQHACVSLRSVGKLSIFGRTSKDKHRHSQW